jgi:hypothetical protein
MAYLPSYLQNEVFVPADADARVTKHLRKLSDHADASAHAGAAQRFMPGITMRRKGDVRQCQGVMLADWEATSPDGVVRMSGTNVFALGLDGRIASATGVATLGT